MADVGFYRYDELPAQPAPRSIIYIDNGAYAEHFVTGLDGVARMVTNTLAVEQIAGQVVADALSDIQQVQYAATFAAAQALGAASDRNLLIVVSDASGAPDVDAGAALYFWHDGPAELVKLAEFEGLDIALLWSNIQGRPTATPGQIDTAVTASFHANRAVLDKLGENGTGGLTYEGQDVGGAGASQWITEDW